MFFGHTFSSDICESSFEKKKKKKKNRTYGVANLVTSESRVVAKKET